MRTLCGGHPYLLQALAARVLACGDLDTAVADLCADPTLGHLFAVDLTLLGEAQAGVLAAVANSPDGVSPCEALVATALHELERLGLVRRTSCNRLVAGNHFLTEWLRAQPST